MVVLMDFSFLIVPCLSWQYNDPCIRDVGVHFFLEAGKPHENWTKRIILKIDFETF